MVEMATNLFSPATLYHDLQMERSIDASLMVSIIDRLWRLDPRFLPADFRPKFVGRLRDWLEGRDYFEKLAAEPDATPESKRNLKLIRAIEHTLATIEDYKASGVFSPYSQVHQKRLMKRDAT